MDKGLVNLEVTCSLLLHTWVMLRSKTLIEYQFPILRFQELELLVMACLPLLSLVVISYCNQEVCQQIIEEY